MRVLAAGAALTVGLATQVACKKDVISENPPPPEPMGNPPPPEPVVIANPPPPDAATALPTWDEVESGHPEGATNPPMPVLVAALDGSACYKAWYDPRAVPAEARQKGGIVLDAGEAPPERATAVQCPADQLAEVLQHHQAAEQPAGEPADQPAVPPAPAEGE